MTLTVELITPEKLLFSEEVDFLAAPASDGEVGILTGHAPLLTKLGAGELRLTRGSDTKYVAVSGGFLEVQKGNRVDVFAETAEFAQDIDIERAKIAAERAKKQIAQADLTGAELAQVEAALARAVLRIRIGESRWRKQAPEGVR